MPTILNLSDMFGRFSRSPALADALTRPPIPAGTALALAEYGYETVAGAPAIINVATAFCLWRQAPSRAVYRVQPPATAYLANVGLSFLPELPPRSWSGAVIVIESTDKSPLVGDIFSLAAYQCEDTQGIVRYFVVGLRAPDGVFAFGTRAALGTINARAAKSGDLIDLAMQSPDDSMVTGPATPEHQSLALAALQFIFATSYYALEPRPDLVTIAHAPGLPERDAHGKTRRANGRPVPLWTYANLTVTPPPPPTGDEHGPLDKSDLALTPVLVRPYVRRLDTGRVVIVDAHDSHRWRRSEDRLGTKTKI